MTDTLNAEITENTHDSRRINEEKISGYLKNNNKAWYTAKNISVILRMQYHDAIEALETMAITGQVVQEIQGHRYFYRGV